MKIISDTNPIIHELSKDISSCTSSFFMSNRHFHAQMLYYTRRLRDLAFGLLNFRKGFFSMQRIITYTISTGESGENVLGFLRKKGFSKHILTTMKRAEQAILLNGQPAFGRTVLREGDVLRILVPEETGEGLESPILPVPLPLDILYEDEDILVLNKPADMPVHPSAGNYENTLANGVAWYYKQQGKAFVYRCINRLDKDTTGVLVLAKNPLSGALLSAQMKQRQIRRTYLALTDGIPPERGTISAPIARMDASVITREVNFERGETAVTHFERLAVSNGYALVELHLDTGRTHQIRVHMKYIGCPLPGDFLYHPVFDRIGRQALHSFQLEFAHPITGEPMCFLAPVPEDFRRAFLQ